MRNFLIFFEEKEGTSPLVRLLCNFDKISVVHQINNSGWEPFDSHNCGPMSIQNLEQCLDLVFNEEYRSMDRLNSIYMKTATKPLEAIKSGVAVGFKMRFRPPKQNPLAIRNFSLWNRLSGKFLNNYQRVSFKKMMFRCLRRHNIVVFFAVRQDVLRWGLSKYHGDGQDKQGHLQFKLARGKINRDQIEKIHINCTKLESIIEKCKESYSHKRNLMDELKRYGIDVYPLFYEEFIRDKLNYFQRVCSILEVQASKEKIHSALTLGSNFKKVHSDDISDFVLNHEE